MSATRRTALVMLGLGSVSAVGAGVAIGKVAPGIRLSTDENDDGYGPWRRFLFENGGNGPLVFLDGLEQKHVLTADENAGLIVRAVRDEHGELMLDESRDSIITETIYGRVQILRPSV